MLKAIQVKIQEQVSYRKKILEFAWFYRLRETGSIDPESYL